MKKIIIALIMIFILRNAIGCNSGTISFTSESSTLLIDTSLPPFTTTMILYYSPTITPSITPTTSPTMYPTINTRTNRMTEWYVYLTFNWWSTDNPKSFIDLDTMELSESPQSDLRYKVSGGSDLFPSLTPLNGALARSMGSSNINLEECIEVSNLLTKYIISEVFYGNHICMLSNKGRMFLIKLDSLTVTNQNSLYKLALLIVAYK
jgi:hypothetical protein